MTLRRTGLTAALTLVLCSSAYAQTLPFEFRVYHKGLRAAATVPPAEEVDEEEEAPPLPPALPPIADPHVAQMRALLHMDSFSGAGPLDEKGGAWVANNVSVVGGGMYGTGALAFTHPNSWVEGPNIFFQGASYTIEAWVKPSSTAGIQPVVASYSDNAAQRYFLLTLENGVPRFRFSWVDLSGGAAPANTWTHLAAMHLNGGFYLYVNGVQVGSIYQTDMYPNSTMRTTLGNTYNSSGMMGAAGMTTFQGLMDEVRLTRAARYAMPNGYQALPSFEVPDRPYANP